MKIARTHGNAVQMRRLLRQSGVSGATVGNMSDNDVLDAGERFLDDLNDAFPHIAEGARRFGEVLKASVETLAKLSRSLPRAT